MGDERNPFRSEELLERTEELARIDALLSSVQHGAGGAVLVISGPAGIGKTSLLDACRRDATARDMEVLGVRGDDLGMESAFSAVRDLLQPHIRATGPDVFVDAAKLAAPVFAGNTAGGWDRDRAGAVLHGLFWLVADLCERGPLVLIVDDAHWLDAASIRFLTYLGRRADPLALLLAVAVRRGEGVQPAGLLTPLSEVAAAHLHPSAMSKQATETLVRRVLGARADSELCRACHEATGGNPFYLQELVGALLAEGGRPTHEAAERLQRIGASAVGKSVLVRLGRLDPDCRRFAEVLTVLAPQSPLRRVAALAGLPRERAMQVADQLRAADLLAREDLVAFAHPIVREAIAAELAPSHRAGLHSAAAELLGSEGAPADEAAAHLLSSEPFGEQWVVEALRSAAHQALAQGAPEAAVSYLRRALAEPPAAELRLEILLELGRAEVLLPSAHDFAALREALELCSDLEQRAEIAMDLALGLFGVLRNVEAHAVLTDALSRESELEPATVDRLEQALIGAGGEELATLPEVNARAERHFERAAREEVDDPRMLAALAGTAAMMARPAAEVASLARRALEDERLLSLWLDDGYVTAIMALSWVDETLEVMPAIARGLQEAARRGFSPMVFQLTYLHCEAAWRSGDLEAAEEDAGRTLALGRDLGAEDVALLWPVLIELERGRRAEAADMIESLAIPVGTFWGANLTVHRGYVRIASGRSEEGLADLLAAGSAIDAAGADLSVQSDWVPAAAATLAALGREQPARQLADRELARALAFGAPRRLGMAFSTCGSLDAGEEGMTWLREGVAVLDRCGAALEHARALINLGVGLRMRGNRVEARVPLAEALDIAHRRGATALSERARRELLACGARPRRTALSGPEALTPAELQTARMAAEGLSNREIAQARFVSIKAVEGLLSQAYSKLRIGGRSELGPALRDASQG